MHPILFRIPLPKMPLKLWWGLAAVIAIAAVYLLIGVRKKDRTTAGVAAVVAVAAGILAFVYKKVEWSAPNLPIYSYGVMLGLSLVVGWYITLTLAERDGLPKETMANCYVITAIAAIVGSRLLYILTNLDEFRENVHDPNSAINFQSFFALRRGGLVAYGGFLGGYLGSWIYLRAHKIRLMPWADVAVPSLASGLLVTRIGCYLFGCDFGTELSEKSPGFLKKLGTFPHWAAGTLDGGEGSPAWVRHVERYKGRPLYAELQKLDHSFPVHPTQLYESLVGLALLALLLWQRKNQKFRGQIFFLFAFAYGYLRFLIELKRDDSERGEFGPMIAEHWFITLVLLAMAIAFTFGISLGIANLRARTIARVLSFLPPVVAFIVLKPDTFAAQKSMQLSTSQWIGFITACIVAYFYAQFWETARKTPKLAMSLESLGDIKPAGIDAPRKRRKQDDDDDDSEEDDDDDVEDIDDKPAPKKKIAAKKKAAVAEPPADEDEKKKDEDQVKDQDQDQDQVETAPAPEVVEKPKPKEEKEEKKEPV